MLTRRVPLAVFSLGCLGFLLFVGLSAPLLPDPVASHFNALGEPDGWMSKGGYLLMTSIMGVALPLFLVGIMYVTRFLPDWMINLPHKEYWLSPEQRPHTNAYLMGLAFWLGSLVLGLMTGTHYLSIEANRSLPVRLPGTSFSVILACFLVGIAVWCIVLIRRFRNPR